MKKINLLALSIFSFVIIQSYKLCGQVPVTVAGGNGEGAAANQLSGPTDVFVDPAGNMYIADTKNNRVQKWAPGATSGVTVAGGNGKGYFPANLNEPSSIFVDAAGNVYVVDQFNFRVQRWAPGATSGVTVAGGNDYGVSSNELIFPWSLFVDAAGNIYVTDRVISRVQKFVPGSTKGVTVAGGNGPGSAANQLNNPYGIFVDAAGNIYVGDANNNRIQKWAPGAISGVTVAGGNGSGPADNQVNFPVDLTVDAQENIYLIDGPGHRIVKWAPGASSGTTIVSGLDTGGSPLLTPYGFFRDAKGDFYIADRDNNRIQKYTLSTPLPAPPSRGLSYRYYEGDWNTIPNFNELTPLKTGNSDNIDLSVRTPGRNDNYAFVWEGYINITTPGYYTFETVSDDGSKFYFNNFYNPTVAATVNNDGVHAPLSVKENVAITNPGVYPIAITFFEKTGGEQMQLYWTGPGFTRQPVPDSAFTKTPLPTIGLAFKYYEGDWNALPDFDSLSPVKTGYSANVDVSVRTPGRNDKYAFVWQGYINITVPGSYTFETVSDDGSKLYFNQKYNFYAFATVRNDGLHPPTSATGTVTITKPGLYPIAITYFEKTGGEQMQVYWTGPDIPRQLIPDSVFTQTSPLNQGIAYKVYNWNANYEPYDFTNLVPIKSGTSSNIDISVRPKGKDDHFAFLWSGYLHIPGAGAYTLEIVSDDGSRLYYNHLTPTGFPLLSNDGVHAPVSVSVNFNLPAAQTIPIAISYFDNDGGELMQLYWSGPGISRQLVPDSALTIYEDIAVSNYLLRTEPGLQTSNLSAITKQGPEISRIYPNPFNESFNVDFYNSSAANDVQVGVYDLKGRLIYMHNAGKMPDGNNTIRVNINKNKLAAGLYIMRLQVNGIPLKVEKLMKIK